MAAPVTLAEPKQGKEVETEDNRPRRKKAKAASKSKSRIQAETTTDISVPTTRKKKPKQQSQQKAEVEPDYKNVVDAKVPVPAAAPETGQVINKRKGKKAKSTRSGKVSTQQIRPQSAKPDLVPTADSNPRSEDKGRKIERNKSLDVIKKPISPAAQISSSRWSQQQVSSLGVNDSEGLKRLLSARARAALHYGQVLTDAVVGLVDEKLKANDDESRGPSKARLSKSPLKARETRRQMVLSRASSSSRGDNKKGPLKSAMKTSKTTGRPKSVGGSQRVSRTASKTKVLYQEGSSYHGLGGDFITTADKYERPNIEEAVRRASRAVADATGEIETPPKRSNNNSRRPSTVPMVAQGIYSQHAQKIMEASRYNVAVHGRGGGRSAWKAKNGVPSQGAMVRGNRPQRTKQLSHQGSNSGIVNAEVLRQINTNNPVNSSKTPNTK